MTNHLPSLTGGAKVFAAATLAALCGLMASSVPVQAASATFIGGSTAGNWSDSTRWINGAGPTANDDAFIGYTTGTTSKAFFSGGNYSVKSIRLGDGLNADAGYLYFNSGSNTTLTVDSGTGSITSGAGTADSIITFQQGDYTETINAANVTLDTMVLGQNNANGSYVIPVGQSWVGNSMILGNTAVGETGVGTLSINGTANFGTVNIAIQASNGGNLTIDKGGTLSVTTLRRGGFTTGVAGTATFNWNDGAIQSKTGGSLTIYSQDATKPLNIQLSGTGTCTLYSTAGQTITEQSTVAFVDQPGQVGTLTIDGGGTVVVSSTANSYSGATFVDAGTLQISATGSLGTGDVEVAAGATLTLQNRSALASKSNVVLDGTNSYVNLNYSGSGTIKTLCVSGTYVNPGNYTAAQLNSICGGSRFSGAGSLTVSARSLASFPGAQPGPGHDNMAAFTAALSWLQSNPGGTLLVPEGQWYILTTGSAPPGYTNQSGYHLFGINLQNATIEGADGAEIDFGQYSGGILFANCSGLTIKNIAFSYGFKLFSQGTVTAIDTVNHVLTLLNDPGYPNASNTSLCPDGVTLLFGNPSASWLTLHDPNGPSGMSLAYYNAVYATSGTGVVSGPGGTVKYPYSDPALDANPPATPCRYVRVSRGAGPMLAFQFCNDVVIDSNHIYSASGFALLPAMTTNLTFTNNTIEPRPGSTDMIATCADGLHCIGGKGTFNISNNTFDSLEDDNVNIIQRGNSVHSIMGSGNKLSLLASSYNYYAVNDTVRLYDFNNNAYSDYQITSIAQSGTFPAIYYQITLSGTPSNVVLYSSTTQYLTQVFNRSWNYGATSGTAAVTISNNQFLYNRARSTRICASGVNISQNYFDTSAYPPILLYYGQDPSLIESPCDNVTIDHNTINKGENNGGMIGGYGSISVCIADRSRVSTHSYIQNCTLLQNIVVTSNTLTNCGQAGISCINTNNLTITGNTVTDACQLLSSRAWNYSSILSAISSPAPTILNNTCTGPASGIIITGTTP